MKQRSTGELLVLMIASTVCLAVLLGGGTLAIISIKTSRDVSSGVNSLTDIINTLIGLLAGFMAGRTELTQRTKAKNEPADE